jgi:hypothetical protein
MKRKGKGRDKCGRGRKTGGNNDAAAGWREGLLDACYSRGEHGILRSYPSCSVISISAECMGKNPWASYPCKEG